MSEKTGSIVSESVAKGQAGGITPDVLKDGVSNLNLGDNDTKKSEPRTIKPTLQMPGKESVADPSNDGEEEGEEEYKPLRLSEMFPDGAAFVFRSPTSPKSKSGFGRSMTGTSMDSALSDDSQGSTGADRVRSLHERLQRYSQGCHNPMTEENMKVDPEINDPEKYTVVGRVPIGVAPVDYEVSLLDRPGEMVKLLKFNTEINAEIQRRLGPEKYAEMVQLWTKTTRGKMHDREWLQLTHDALVTGLGGDKGPWTRFRMMVGFDPMYSDPNARPFPNYTPPPRKASESKASGEGESAE